MPKKQTALLPQKEWRKRLEQQATGPLFDRLRSAARTRLRTFAGPTGHVNEADIDDVVASVIADTLDGTLGWDPNKESLEDNLVDAVRFRARDKWEREQAQLHVPLAEDEYDYSVTELAAVGTAVPTQSPSPTRCDRARQIKVAHDKVIEWLRPRASDKPDVLCLLGLYLDGIVEREEVMREGGMSESTYHNARRCLGRLVRRMPAKLRAAARQMASGQGDL
jgi:hypothetical protein